MSKEEALADFEKLLRTLPGFAARQHMRRPGERAAEDHEAFVKRVTEHPAATEHLDEAVRRGVDSGLALVLNAPQAGDDPPLVARVQLSHWLLLFGRWLRKGCPPSQPETEEQARRRRRTMADEIEMERLL